MESSSIVNMEIVNSDDESDYGGENSFRDSSPGLLILYIGSKCVLLSNSAYMQ